MLGRALSRLNFGVRSQPLSPCPLVQYLAKIQNKITENWDSGKTQAVHEYLLKLDNDLENPSLTDQERDTILEKLKVFGRDPVGCDEIFTEKGIRVLAEHAFRSPTKAYARQSLRCLANALLLKESTRSIFVKLGFAPKACQSMAMETEDEFLSARVLFLTTYASGDHLVELVKNHQLANVIVKNLKRHAARPCAQLHSTEEMALTDTLKLLYNTTAFLTKSHQSTLAAFSPAIPYIISILMSTPLPTPKPLGPPIDRLINPLTNLDLTNNREDLFPPTSPTDLASYLVEILGKALETYAEDEVDMAVSPLATLILELHSLAPENVRLFFRNKLLPQPDDRVKILGTGTTLPSRILRNATNSLAPNLRQVFGQLLFELSDKDASEFVKNVGYGYASGYLFNNKISVPESSRSTCNAPCGREVNPITGQWLDLEGTSEIPPMTNEEKEREAERLFVLFERLKATGVVDVENPVHQAYQTGTIQEIESDDD